MSKLKVLAVCPEWPLVRAFSRGHWTQAYAELFASSEDQLPSHIHIYDRKVAVDAFLDGAFNVPDSVTSVSYS